MVGDDRLADNVWIRIMDDKWIWHGRMLDQEP